MVSAEQTLSIVGRSGAPSSALHLTRPHTPSNSPLRAWSAADELALAELGEIQAKSMLVVNDEFGALACGFSERRPTLWNDSALSRAAIATNLAANGLDPADDRCLAGHRPPIGPFDLVVIRLPKSVDLLSWQLHQIVAATAPGAEVVGLGMARHISRATREAFETIVGPTEVSLATRKARLVRARRSEQAASAPVAYDMPEPFTIDDGTIVAQQPGVFSAGRLDVATNLLLTHVQVDDAPHVLDLGCGNGVIAASLARRNPHSRFTLLDVSDLAVEAARQTWHANHLPEARASFVVADGASAIPAGSVDLVVSNPPFHQGHAIDEHLLERLLTEAAGVLAPTGRLVAVAQRDMHIHTRLRRSFADVRVVSKHPVFVVVEASRPQ